MARGTPLRDHPVSTALPSPGMSPIVSGYRHLDGGICILYEMSKKYQPQTYESNE